MPDLDTSHVMRWEFDDGIIRGEAICNAAADADCRLQPADHHACQCEWWGRIERRDDGTIWHLIGELDGTGVALGPDDWHRLIPGDDCNVCLFINESGCPEEMVPRGTSFVIADTAIRPVWIDGGCDWEPIDA